MTTIRDEATALLAEALHTSKGIGHKLSWMGEGVCPKCRDEALVVLLAASPLAADLEFAGAWRRVERALPEGQAMEAGSGTSGWWANAVDADFGGAIIHAEGDTPTAALEALAEMLEATR